MTVAEIVAILQNRLDYNAREREAAHARGDVAAVAQFEADIASTTATLSALRPLVG